MRQFALLTCLAVFSPLLEAQPFVEISTLIGGSGTDRITDVALDDNGDVLVVGATSSPDFPTVDGSPAAAGPDLDAFFLRLREGVDSQGAPLWQIVQSEILGGDEDDVAQTVIPASEGVIVRGDTRSNEFPGSGGPFPGGFSVVIARESSMAAASLRAEGARPKFMRDRRDDLGSIGTDGTQTSDPGISLEVTRADNGDIFVDDNNGGPLEERMIASGTSNAKGKFIGTRLGTDPQDGDFAYMLIEEQNQTVCKLTRFPGMADGTLGPPGDSIELSFSDSVESFSIVVTTKDGVRNERGIAKQIPDRVYVFKKGTGSFAVAGDATARDHLSIDFAMIGDNAFAVCLDAENLRPIRMREQELQFVREAIVETGGPSDGRLTSLGESLTGQTGRNVPSIELRRTGGVKPEGLSRVGQAANTDIVVQFADPDTLQTLEAYRFGGEGNETTVTGAFNDLGDLYIVGMTDGELPLSPGPLTDAPAGDSDGFLIKITDPQPPTLAAEAIVGAADFMSGPIAPGSILSAFAQGTGGLVVAELDDEGKFPAALGGVRFLFDGDPGRMIFSTPGQSNLIAPFSIAGKSTVGVELEVDGLRSPPVQLDVAPTRPQIFSASQQGTGQAALLNQDFSVNGADNPAARGSVIQIFLTGGGQTDPPAVDGALAPTAEPLPRFSDVQVFVGGVECQVVYAGAAPGLVHGVGQINVVIDETVAAGEAVSLEVRIGGVASQADITVAIS